MDEYIPAGSSNHPDPPRYTIDFVTAAGRVVRFNTDSVGFAPRNVGDAVPVLYNPADPDDAFVRGGERVAAYLLGMPGSSSPDRGSFHGDGGARSSDVVIRPYFFTALLGSSAGLT